MQTLIQCEGISKTYWKGSEKLEILSNLQLTIKEGEFVALMGPSGSGKSTLLNLMAGLDVASSGTVTVNGVNLASLNDSGRGKWRSEHVGFIFQTFNLIPVLTAQENVELPLLLTSLSSEERKKRAQIALKAVGLADRTSHLPKQLSGGQEQRVAIARAIVNDPKIIVADEPTGDLDKESAEEILTLLTTLQKQFKKTIIMVTHDPDAAAYAQVTYRLKKGHLQ